jgi:hypothetical protein
MEIIKGVESLLLGQHYAGSVFSIKIEESEKFFECNKDNMSETAINSFLTSLSIPKGFFKERNPLLQVYLVTDTKENLVEKFGTEELLILIIDGTIEYVSPFTLGFKEPTEVLGVDQSKWSLHGFDLKSGSIKYVHYLDDVSQGLSSVIFLTIPIFYQKRISVDVGLCNPKTGSYLIDTYSFETLYVTPKNVNSVVLDSLIESVKRLDLSLYKTFLDRLNDSSLEEYTRGIQSDTTLLTEFFSPFIDLKPCPVPKGIISKVLRHEKILKKKKQVPFNSPTELTTFFDLFNSFCFYSDAHERAMNTVDNQKRKLFNFMWYEVFCSILETDDYKISHGKVVFSDIFNQ